MRVLAAEGAYFDLATTGEVEIVRKQGISPARCIQSHPIKRDSDIRSALAFGVRTFVADNPDEVRKFVKYRHQASLLIRVAFRSPDATCDLSRKFGCEPEAVEALLRLATDQQIDIEGLSFHVGSQTTTPDMYVKAIKTCRELLLQSAQAGRPLRTLDIGGGFPVDYGTHPVPIEEFCAPLRAALATLPPALRLIAEPGRFIVAPAAIGVAAVMGRALRDQQWWYYLDDGLYGSYSGQLYDHATFPLFALADGAERFPSVLAGPTCDSIDVIAENIALPHLGIGDLVVTTLTNDYMPLLRYRIGDLVEKQIQPYGNHFTIHGRARDALTAGDGQRVTTWEVDQCFSEANGIAHYELRQSENGDCVLRFVPEAIAPAQEELRRVTSQLELLLKTSAEIKTEAMPVLIPAASGKFRLTCRGNAT